MNPTRPLFARITINGKRTDLGHATLSQLLLRAAQVCAIHRSSSPDVTLVLEASGAKLPDSSVMNREQILEQALAAQIVTDQNEDSPFEGVTVGRVAEAMSSPEYQAYEYYCQPANREGIDGREIASARVNYNAKFPDCFEHFPRWIES